MRAWNLKGEPREKGGYLPWKFCNGGKSQFPKKQFPGGQPNNRASDRPTSRLAKHTERATERPTHPDMIHITMTTANCSHSYHAHG